MHVRAPDQRPTVNQTGSGTAGVTSCSRTNTCETPGGFFLFFLFLSRLNVPVENNTKDRGEKTLSSAARRVHCLHEIRQDDSHEMQWRVGC